MGHAASIFRQNSSQAAPANGTHGDRQKQVKERVLTRDKVHVGTEGAKRFRLSHRFRPLGVLSRPVFPRCATLMKRAGVRERRQ